jgi:hypothetical protein
MISAQTFRNPFNALRRDKELMADLLIAASMTHGLYKFMWKKRHFIG